MAITSRIAASALFTLICLLGCGVGGFQNSKNAPGPPPADTVLKRVNGVASKGIIRGGKVSIYAVDSNGAPGALLNTTSTSPFGIYSSSVNLTGPALLSVLGAYTDEATGLEAAVPQDAPLRAAVDAPSGVMTTAITPLTELAVRTMPALTASNIAAANKRISELFKVNIITIQPLNPTAQAFGHVDTEQEQKDYTLALAAISQMAHDFYGGSVRDTITAMHKDLTRGDTLGEVVNAQFKAALTTFLQSDHNQTGVRDVNATNLANAGGGTKAFKLTTSGILPPGTSIYGVTVSIALPPGVTIRISNFALHEADPRAVYPSGVFPSNTRTLAYFVPATGSQPALLTVSVPQGAVGSGLGEFLTLVCDVPAGTAFTASDFSLPAYKVVNENGVALPSVKVEIL